MSDIFSQLIEIAPDCTAFLASELDLESPELTISSKKF
jgi:hypothetical protein